MDKQISRAQQFRELHIPNDPVILYNIWDAGSANAVAGSGAKAIATGSWSVAAAQGYSDGEEMPLNELLAVVARIVQTIDLPLTVDFEGGYAADPKTIRQNVRRLLDLGVIGLNFEDQVIDGTGLYDIEKQMERLAAVRQAAEDCGVHAFINARTDIFLQAAPDADHSQLIDDALARGAAYTKAGASGFFVPGLRDESLIQKICAQSALPVNVMMTNDSKGIRETAKLGVSRISFGPIPYRNFITFLKEQAKNAG